MHQTAQSPLDTQQVEIIGRNLLLSCCIADDVEVAQPIRDRGIDLIIFNDVAEQNEFTSLPVQLKAASNMSFSINRKYEKIPGLLMAYTWFSNSPNDAVLYIMRYEQAIALGNDLNWTSTNSWETGGAYSTQSPSKKLIVALEPFKYTPGMIRGLISKSS